MKNNTRTILISTLLSNFIILILLTIGINIKKNSNELLNGYYTQNNNIKGIDNQISKMDYILYISITEKYYDGEVTIKDPLYGNVTFNISGTIEASKNELIVTTKKILLSDKSLSREAIKRILVHNENTMLIRHIARLLDDDKTSMLPRRYKFYIFSEDILCFYTEKPQKLNCLKKSVPTLETRS